MPEPERVQPHGCQLGDSSPLIDGLISIWKHEKGSCEQAVPVHSHLLGLGNVLIWVGGCDDAEVFSSGFYPVALRRK